MKNLIAGFLEPAGVNFVEELVFRFLLTRGDTLGGSMRNVGGFIAQTKLSRAIVACLKIGGANCSWQHSETNTWAPLPEEDASIEFHVRGLAWMTTDGPRTLVYNRNVPFVAKKGKNVDLCLFRCKPDEVAQALNEPTTYIALGELKGGIDPAGADEHWKTAYAALNRIHKAFEDRKLKPHTFFTGAAIESEMAIEIWEMLESGLFENAANLNDEDQVASLTNWLCSLCDTDHKKRASCDRLNRATRRGVSSYSSFASLEECLLRRLVPPDIWLRPQDRNWLSFFDRYQL